MQPEHHAGCELREKLSHVCTCGAVHMDTTFEPGSEAFDQSLQPVVSIAISLKRIADALERPSAAGPSTQTVRLSADDLYALRQR